MFYVSLSCAMYIYVYICISIYLSIYWKSGTSELMVLMLFVLQCTDYKLNFLTLTLTLTAPYHAGSLGPRGNKQPVILQTCVCVCVCMSIDKHMHVQLSWLGSYSGFEKKVTPTRIHCNHFISLHQHLNHVEWYISMTQPTVQQRTGWNKHMLLITWINYNSNMDMKSHSL